MVTVYTTDGNQDRKIAIPEIQFSGGRAEIGEETYARIDPVRERLGITTEAPASPGFTVFNPPAPESTEDHEG